jgi:hypothetical protein
VDAGLTAIVDDEQILVEFRRISHQVVRAIIWVGMIGTLVLERFRHPVATPAHEFHAVFHASILGLQYQCRLTSRFSGPTVKIERWHFIPHGPLQPIVRGHTIE